MVPLPDPRSLSHQLVSQASYTFRRHQSDSAVVNELNKKTMEEQEGGLLDGKLEQEKEKQARAPWHREGADKPPVARQRSAGAMTKGKGDPNTSTW